MRRVRIYQPGPLEKDQTLALSDTAGQHVGVVLRMGPGETLTLFCGDNREFSATIIATRKKKVHVTITAEHAISRESPCVIHLAQGISKGDRMEFVIQKAVELGVASITPLLTAHSVVRLDAERMAKKEAQWQAIAIAACEQSGRNQIPAIFPICSLHTYLNECRAEAKLVLHPTAAKNWRQCSLQTKEAALLIGPEGGLSNEEINMALDTGFQSLALGPRILRTETATIAALSVLQAAMGDF